MDNLDLKSPYPYFGGKGAVAAEVWRRFGDIANYVEPFFGSGAVLLSRPRGADGIETVNDLNGFVANFWRALAADPDAVAYHADWPANENDLHARHAWLVGQKDSMQARLEGDPEYYDTRIAGWWVWGMACWIGGGFCSGKGPWQVVQQAEGQPAELVRTSNAGQGVQRQLPHLGNAGQGVQRQRPHLGNAGPGVQRKRLRQDLYDYLRSLSERLKRVRVSCGDWSRICGPSVTTHNGLTGVFLDPPYDLSLRHKTIYSTDSPGVAIAVREWAIRNGNNRLLRIALCGYDGEHVLPKGWKMFEWKTRGGMGNTSKAEKKSRGKSNRTQERIWFSPHCLIPQPGLFDGE